MKWLIVLSCVRTYNQYEDFRAYFKENDELIEVDVSHLLEDIHDKVFEKGPKMVKFPFKAKIEVIFGYGNEFLVLNFV